MLSREAANLFKYLIVVNSRGWHVRSGLMWYSGRFRMTVVVDGSIGMVMVVMVMMMW